MFCTPDKWDTCEVEKRGCEGCFYMNEEEIIIKGFEGEDIKCSKFTEKVGNNIIDYKFEYENNKILMKLLNEELDKEKEKNKKLEALSNNLAKAIKFMGTNSELTVEEILKIFSPEEIAIDFDEFMERWENSQREESHLKDKIIDEMAEDLYKYDDQLETGKFFEIEEVKQYYFKKARGEENV